MALKTPAIFGPAWYKASTARSSLYTTHYGSISLLERVRGLLGVSKRRLGRMLGLPLLEADTMIYRWLNGRARPSQLYMSRLLHLVLLHLDGKLNIETFDGQRYWNEYRPDIRFNGHQSDREKAGTTKR